MPMTHGLRWNYETLTPRGYGALLRDADDALAVFELEADAQRFMRVLPQRLGRFGRRLNPHKTQVLAFGQRLAWRQLETGQRPAPCDSLGFTHYWGRSRNGTVRLQRKTSKKRLRRALGAINHWLQEHRNRLKLPDLWRAIALKMRGHFNSFNGTDNRRALSQFQEGVRKLLFKWLHRRSQRNSFTWESLRRYSRRYPLPRPGQVVSLNPVWSRAV
jgi:hypothetical protein